MNVEETNNTTPNEKETRIMNLELSPTDQKVEELFEELQDLLHAWANTNCDQPKVHRAIDDFGELYNLAASVAVEIISG